VSGVEPPELPAAAVVRSAVRPRLQVRRSLPADIEDNGVPDGGFRAGCGNRHSTRWPTPSTWTCKTLQTIPGITAVRGATVLRIDDVGARRSVAGLRASSASIRKFAVEPGAPHEAEGKWDRIAWLKSWTSDKMSHAARIAQNPTR